MDKRINKLSNKEEIIIKKDLYEKEITEVNNESVSSSNSLFKEKESNRLLPKNRRQKRDILSFFEYNIMGSYEGNEEDNDVDAIAITPATLFSGLTDGLRINTHGGNDNIKVATLAVTINTGSGNDTVVGGTAYMSITNPDGDLNVSGASGYAQIHSLGTGNINYVGATGGVELVHQAITGHTYAKTYSLYNKFKRMGGNGNLIVEGVGGYNEIYSSANVGNININLSGGYNSITRQGGVGDINGNGIAAYNEIISRVWQGDINIDLLGGYNKVTHSGRKGNINSKAISVYNNIVSNVVHGDVNANLLAAHNSVSHFGQKGNVNIKGISAFNYIYSSVIDGDINVNLTAGYNKIIREHNNLLLNPSDIQKPETTGDISFWGNGIANYIVSDVDNGQVNFEGNGIANIINHRSKQGDTYFRGTGGANIVLKTGQQGDLVFEGQGIANVVVNKVSHGTTTIEAKGVANVFIRQGNGKYNANLLAMANISIMSGDNEERNKLYMLGGLNTHTHLGHGDNLWLAAGGLNLLTHQGNGNLTTSVAGGGNVITKIGNGNIKANMLGMGNILTQINQGDREKENHLWAIAVGGANIITKQGVGDLQAFMGGGLNVLTHLGDGESFGLMVGGGNILTKVGHGNVSGIMFGLGNIFTQIGDGRTIGIMGAAGNIFTKVGDGQIIAAMLGGGNLFTHIGVGNTYAFMAGIGNIFTKVNDSDNEDDVIALMIAKANIFTQIGHGTTVIVMAAKGNIATKVGNGCILNAMLAVGNIFTHVGDGETFSIMLGKANVLTKVGDGFTAALLAGSANILTHVHRGDSTTLGIFLGKINIMNKVGSGTSLGLMFGDANIMNHVGDGITGALAMGKANIITKVGDGFMGVVAKAKGNVITHIGDGPTAGLLFGKANILTKVGDGALVGLLVSDGGNVMTHLSQREPSNTVAFAKGKANLINKIGSGLSINALWGKANIATQIGNGERYNFAKGRANIISKIGEGREITLVQGDANIITHLGDGDDYVGTKGKANIVTKVGDGRLISVAKGDSNIISQIGTGMGVNILWGKLNMATKMGNGLQINVLKAKGNITTTVGTGTNIVAAYGDTHINTKIGAGTAINALWGNYILTSHIGDGTNIAVMKGKGNANIHIGDGLMIHATYARNNIAIKVGNGDFYALSVASSNTQSNKLAALFDNIKQSVLGNAASQAINELISGKNALISGNSSGVDDIHISPIPDKLAGLMLTENTSLAAPLESSLTHQLSELKAPDLDSLAEQFSVENASSNTTALNTTERVQSTTDNSTLGSVSPDILQPVMQDKQAALEIQQRLNKEKNRHLSHAQLSLDQLNHSQPQELVHNGDEIQQSLLANSSILSGQATDIAQRAIFFSQPEITNIQQPLSSGMHWRQQYAAQFIHQTQDKAQQQLADSSQILNTIEQQLSTNYSQVKTSVLQSEQALINTESDYTVIEPNITITQQQVAQKVAQAVEQQNETNNSKNQALNRSTAAKDAAERQIIVSNKKLAAQSIDEVKALKQNDDYRPQRTTATVSGLALNKLNDVELENEDLDGSSESEIVLNIDTAGIRASEQPIDGRLSNQIKLDQFTPLISAAQQVLSQTELFDQSLAPEGINQRRNSALAENRFTNDYLAPLWEQGGQKVESSSSTVIDPSDHEIDYTLDDIHRSLILAESSVDSRPIKKLLARLKQWLPTFSGDPINDMDLLQKSAPRALQHAMANALANRYLIEERIHGAGGGKTYLQWLNYLLEQQSVRTTKSTDIDSVEQQLIATYNQRYLSAQINLLLTTQSLIHANHLNKINLLDNETIKIKKQHIVEHVNQQFKHNLEQNGMTKNNQINGLNNEEASYQKLMDSIKNSQESSYFQLNSSHQTLAISVNPNYEGQSEGQYIYSLYDPDIGIQSFDHYADFQQMTDRLYQAPITNYFAEQHSKAREQSTVLEMGYNQYKNSKIITSDSVWKQAIEGEAQYVIQQLQAQKKVLSIGNKSYVQIISDDNDIITVELTTPTEKKLQIQISKEKIRHIEKDEILVDRQTNNNTKNSDIKCLINILEKNLAKILIYSHAEKIAIKPAEFHQGINIEVLKNSNINPLTFNPCDILDKVNHDLNKSSTLLSTIDFIDLKTFTPNSAAIHKEWQEMLRNINTIRQVYFPHDIARYFATLKQYRVGNCGDRALYAAHLIINDHNYQGEVELLKLTGDGDHVFVRIGGDSPDALILDPWTGRYFHHSVMDRMLFNPNNHKIDVHQTFAQLKTLFSDLSKIDILQQQLAPLGPKRKTGLKLTITPEMTPFEMRKAEYQRQGILVAEGSFGLVICDPKEPHLLIKDMGQAYESAVNEAIYFNRFYGDGSADVHRDGQGNVYLTMLKVPGTVVSSLSAQQLPINARELYLTMVADLADRNIYHQDLHLGNVMYDAENQRFWPIDFESSQDADQSRNINSQIAVAQFERGLHLLGGDDALNQTSERLLYNSQVDNWMRLDVNSTNIIGNNSINDLENHPSQSHKSQYDTQLIIQLENDITVAKAAANLAGKHPKNTVIVQLDSAGDYRVVYGDPSLIQGKIRWQLVGHGRELSQDNHQADHRSLAGYSADQLAVNLARFQTNFQANNILALSPHKISLVGCSLIGEDKQQGFARDFMQSLAEQQIRCKISARNSEVAVDLYGHKQTRDEHGKWNKKYASNKVVLDWNDNNHIVSYQEPIRQGIAEGEIDIHRMGLNQQPKIAYGVIGDDREIYTPPLRSESPTAPQSTEADKSVSYSGNIEVQIGDGESTLLNWGTSNAVIKVGNGGVKAVNFGDNNLLLHIGDGDSKHSINIGGYQAFEGAQIFIGSRNISFNHGRSNDVILMAEKSIPLPPLVNPFDGAARMAQQLQQIADAGEQNGRLKTQDQQWSLAGVQKYLHEMATLDGYSNVDYTTLTELNSQYQRSGRGLDADIEANLNKRFSQWLSGNPSQADGQKLSRAQKLQQLNQKITFNFAVGGQGEDIQLTHGNWNFIFGDNIQSILDTNIGSLFGIISQQYSATGLPKTTWTYAIDDMPRQFKHRMLQRMASINADTTLADIFGVQYSATGALISIDNQPLDTQGILLELSEIMFQFGGEQLSKFTDPQAILNSLQANLALGQEGIRTTLQQHGLIEKHSEIAADPNSIDQPSDDENLLFDHPHSATASAIDSQPEARDFGFNSLQLPNIFAMLFNRDKQSEMATKLTEISSEFTKDILNMEQKTVDFLRHSGFLKNDGDFHLSMGNYNFNWGGDGNDLGAYTGDNNNFWGGRGDDTFYGSGLSNLFSGGEGDDIGVLTGRENTMFGGKGDDFGLVAGRVNSLYMGDGNDKAFVFGENGIIEMGTGGDYAIVSGNFNQVSMQQGQDYAVVIGNNNKLSLGEGNDLATIFGNENQIHAQEGHDRLKLMGYHSVISGGTGRDHLIASNLSKFSVFDGGEDNDIISLGGYENQFYGGGGSNSFIVSKDIISNRVMDIQTNDYIVLKGLDRHNLGFERSNNDLRLWFKRFELPQGAQQQFESLGVVTFNNYFAETLATERAKIVIHANERESDNQRDYMALTGEAVDQLVNLKGHSGINYSALKQHSGSILNGIDEQIVIGINQAWGDVVQQRGYVA